MNPLISVILPVHNGEAFLSEAIQSVLGQTFTDFELIVINDGSTDGSAELLEQIRDVRLRLLSSERNQGLVHALNWGVAEARGSWIARMDADDICSPDRFARQLAYLKKHPGIDVLGTGAREMDATGRVVRPLKRPEYHDFIACEMLFRCVMIHPTVMGRAEVFKKIPYRTGPAEDYGLWIEMLEQGVKFGNVRSALLDYRMHAQNMSTTKWNAQTLGMWNDQREYLNRLFSTQVSDQEFRLHSLLFATPEEMPDGKVDWKGLSDWVKTLIEANEKANALNRNALISTLWVAWCSLAKKTGSLEWDALPKFHPIDYHSLTYVTHYLLPQ
jgi:glycosyltransferase involved in cell wall biosynthesis